MVKISTSLGRNFGTGQKTNDEYLVIDYLYDLIDVALHQISLPRASQEGENSTFELFLTLNTSAQLSEQAVTLWDNHDTQRGQAFGIYPSGEWFKPAAYALIHFVKLVCLVSSMETTTVSRANFAQESFQGGPRSTLWVRKDLGLWGRTDY